MLSRKVSSNTGSSQLGSGKLIPALQARFISNVRSSIALSVKSDSSAKVQQMGGTVSADALNEKKPKRVDIPESVQALMQEYKIAMKDLNIDVSSSVPGAVCVFGKTHKGTLRGRPCECELWKSATLHGKQLL